MCLGCGSDASNNNAAPEQQIGDTGNEDINKLTSQIAANPKEASLYAQRGNLFYKNDGYDEAIQDLTVALSLDSTNVNYHHLLADIYLDYYKSRLALKTMERAAQLYPKRIPTLLKLSEFQLILKMNEASLKTIDKVLQIDPQNSEAFFMMGLNFKEMEDINRAINSFQKAVELDPDLVDGWINLGQLHASIKGSLAEKFFDTAIEVDSTSAYALQAKADFYADQGDLDKALEYYKKITSLDAQNEIAFFNSGLLYLDKNDPQKAYEAFDITIKVSPLHIRAYAYRGLAAEKLGKIAEAKADYKQALTMAPDYQIALDGLARVKDL
ncbi:MAG: hypothetical protein DHS20C18_02120 [Saprospiraceae bacterium]|nr:MAG: hypothetical protein DHS20C18_02120 [Saprospiraceae bacterium]